MIDPIPDMVKAAIPAIMRRPMALQFLGSLYLRVSLGDAGAMPALQILLQVIGGDESAVDSLEQALSEQLA